MPQRPSLSHRVITVACWIYVAGGGTMATLMARVPEVQWVRVGLNLTVVLFGVVGLVLLRSGRERWAANLVVWGLWGLISVLVVRNGGLMAPNLLNYPVLVVLAGWLLGPRPTRWLVGLSLLWFALLFVAERAGWLPPVAAGTLLAQWLFCTFVVLLTALITLLSRRDYEQQVEQLTLRGAELHERELRLSKLSRAVEQSPESIIITDLLGRIEYVNDAFVEHTGYTRAEALGRNPSFLQSGQTPAQVYQNLWATLARGQPWRGEFVNRKKTGELLTESVNIGPIRQPDGRITHYVAVEQDVTAMRKAESEIVRLVNYDQLTGLPNRTLLLDRLGRILTNAQRHPRFGALILINIDRFKNINEARGHAFGDRLLQAFGRRTGGYLREGDTLARLSADEFAILLHDLGPRREAASQRVLAVVAKIEAEIRVPFPSDDGADITVTASLGVALCPEGEGDSVAEVMRRADTALHRAKSAGGARAAFFDSAMAASAEQRFTIERELRRGIAEGQLRLYLQPQVTAAGVRCGAEALVRWQHPQRGLLPPGVFIPIAEESDLIAELETWVLTQSCKLIAQETSAGRSLQVSVNISPRHFKHSGFVEHLRNILAMTGADPTQLMLEVTEGLVIEDINDVIAKMQQLTQLGFHFSIDDFGTGYSSLAYLKRLPIHEIKIDKTFVQDAPNDADDAALVETILAVARHMRLQVVAEGVETQAQADFLNARGEVVHQGYLFGRPEPAAVWLERWQQG